jgi:plasmid stabilization system protein ParE
MGNENNRYSVIISAKANQMLVDHARFLANVSEEAARNFIDEFKHSASSLELLPERNPWLTDPALPINKYRKLIFGKRYIIIYQIKSGKVYLDNVLDCRQDYKWLM